MSVTEKKKIDDVNEATLGPSRSIKPTARQTDQEKERTRITNIRNERGNIATDPREIQG